MKTITCYKCDFCGSVSEHRAYMKGHEKKCFMNPALKACKTCRYWCKNQPEMDISRVCSVDEDMTPRDFRTNPLPFCSCPKGRMSSVVKTDRWGEWDGIGDMPMKNCPCWEAIPGNDVSN